MGLCKCGCGKEICKEKNLTGFIHGHQAEDWTGWAKGHEYCIDCGTTDKPHQANGRCGTCHVNNLNREKGIQKRNIGAWAWYYDECQGCGTTERPHIKDGLCRDCYEASRRDFSNGYEICPVCDAKVVKLNQHISMRAKNCKNHRIYKRDLEAQTSRFLICGQGEE